MSNVLQYLEDTSKRLPNKIAVSMNGKGITFLQFRSFARRLGYVLLSKNINGGPIGVFANRTIDTIVWFSAVLYSGNFYIPLDPDMPVDKMRAIIKDSHLNVIVGSLENKDKIRDLCFNGSFVTPKDMTNEECSMPVAKEEDPLYMVYTSGSTGKPKGVLKSHKAMISFIESYCETFQFTENEIIGNQTPFFFDASAKDIYLMLKCGATMEIIPTEIFSMPTMLIEYLNEKKITFASWVPTALSIVAQLNPFSLIKPTSLKKLFFVGEVMPMKYLNKWREALPKIEYINLYGQSEIAGICCFYKVLGEFDNTDVIPIGKPLSNCKVYLLDEGQLITEPGHIGEIYIESPALATEYYQDAEKTNACFVKCDFGDGPIRCFKTGDMAKYDNEKNLVFAARNDFQIKHMGHRIELGEIENAAGSLNEVARCCCLYNSERRKIVLFCELERGVNLTGAQVKSLLREKLSSYMLPTKVVIMDRIPINANGKTDRRALNKLL